MNLQEVYIKPDGGESAWVYRDADSCYPFFANDICCDCDQPAKVITDASPRSVYADHPATQILWGQCEGCATESRCQDIDAGRQADYDCEDDRVERLGTDKAWTWDWTNPVR